MDDLISRQDAIDALTHKWDGMVTSVFDVLKELPSAELEELKAEADELGYRLVKKTEKIKLLPCSCGCIRRPTEWVKASNGSSGWFYKCDYCNKESEVVDTKIGAKRAWNRMIFRGRQRRIEMDDSISRQTAIETVSNLASSMSVCSNIDESHGMKRMQEMAVMVLSRLPSAEPEWIPVSERLPEKHDEVLVTARGEVSIAWMYLDKKWRSIDMPEPMFKDIIAWMPMPKPPKMEGEQNG